MSPSTINYDDLSFPGAPKIHLAPPGPKSKELLEYQAAHESSAISYAKGMPMAVWRAKGATVEDMDGNIYIDCFGGAGVIHLLAGATALAGRSPFPGMRPHYVHLAPK